MFRRQSGGEMIFFKKKADGFFRGLGAEFAFKTKDGVFIISGGKVLKVVLRAPETGGRTQVVLIEGSSEHVVFEGGMEEAARRFVEISNSATDQKSRVHVSRRWCIAVLAGFTAIAMTYSYLTSPYQMASSDAADVNALLQSLPTVAQSTAPVGLQGLPAGLGSVLTAPQTNQLNSGSLIVDKPAFLSLPGEPAPAEKDDAKGEEPKEEVSVVPAYTEDLYTKKAVPDAVSAEKVTPLVNAPAPSVPEQKVSDASPAQPITPVAKDNKGASEAPPEASVKVETTAKEQALVSAKPDELVGDKKAEVKAEPLSPEQTKKLAQTAVTNLLSSGMSANEAASVIGKLENMSQMDPDEITPEMLAGLPHELVKLLKDSGLTASKKQEGENGVPFAIIRLPDGVIEKFRGKDGIPSIPTNDSYAALGNKITLQLPGGGDIRTPEDMLGFGFKP